jgi:predicted alpha/beta superfamily hydrolase
MKQITLLFFFCISVFSQKNTETFDSYKLGEKREISIALPTSYDQNQTKKYPLLFLLDGEYLFDPFNGALTYGAYWDDLPEMIIVSVNQNKNGERYSDSSFDPVTGIPVRKGALFFEFVAGELIPYIEKKYRVAPFRIIAGHDTTAGFLNFFLYKDAPLFNAFISLSPELAPEMERRIPEKLSNLKQPVFYYLSSGDSDIPQLLEPIKTLDENIKALQNPHLSFRYDSFKDATHYSLVLFSIPSALYQIFGTYKPISSTEYSDKIVILQNGYADYLINRYDDLFKKTGLRIPVRLNDFKAIEAAIIKNNAYNEFDKLAEIANEYYPKSMLGDYYLGLMYEKNGDAKRAMKKFQSASQAEEIGGLTKDMMYEKYDEMKSLTQKK